MSMDFQGVIADMKTNNELGVEFSGSLSITRDKLIMLELKSEDTPESNMNLITGITSISENTDRTGEILLNHGEVISYFWDGSILVFDLEPSRGDLLRLYWERD